MPYTVLILIAILFSTANLVQAQAKYRATYRDSVPNNFHEIRAKMQAGELSFPEDSALISLQLLKFIQSNFIHSSICSPIATRSETFSGNEGELAENKVSSKARNSGYAIYNRKDHIVTVVNTKNGVTDTVCKYKGEPEERFKPTGKKKKINGWLCKEYIPERAEYSEYVIWASQEVPEYVKQSYPGIKGGIVQENIRGRRFITLISLTKTNIEIEMIPCKEIIPSPRNFKKWYDDYETDELFN